MFWSFGQGILIWFQKIENFEKWCISRVQVSSVGIWWKSQIEKVLKWVM